MPNDFFATCERDEHGWCTSGGDVQAASLSSAVYQEQRQWGSSIPRSQKNALQDYVGTSDTITELLKDKDPLKWAYSRKQTTIREITKLIDSAPPLSESIEVYRGLPENIASSLKVGDTYRDPAFVSTSIDKKTAELFGKPVIVRVPKGTKAVSIDAALGEGSGEMELLLQKNSTFKVSSHRDGMPVLVLNLLTFNLIATRNKRRNVRQLDPTRTTTLRAAFARQLRRKFRRLKGAVYKHLVVDDAYGLRSNAVRNTFDPDQPRDEEGQWTSEGAGGAGGAGGTKRIMTGPEQFQVSRYKNTGFAHVNGVLRKGELGKASQSTQESVAVLDRLIAEGSLEEPATLFRVLDGKRVGDRYLKEGAVVEDKAFMSTSTDESAAMRAADDAAQGIKTATTLEIRAPAGTKAFDLQSHAVGGAIVGSQTDEKEVLLPRNTKLRIVSVDHENRKAVAEIVRNSFTVNAPANRFKFASSSEKLAEFRRWLRQEFKGQLLGKSDEELWRRYTQRGFERGAGRAFDDAKQTEKQKAFRDQKVDFWEGSRQEFLRSAFGRPETREKVQLLAERSFEDLKNVTEDMATKMGRVLADGLVEGKNPRDIADDLEDVLDVGGKRAETIARTEIIRAHSEGQLDAFDRMGVEEIGVMVEWSTAGDDRVCEECAPMEGVVLRVAEAHGMIPRHPNCRCAFIPANVGEDDVDQTRGKSGVEGAVRESLKEAGQGKDDWGPDRDVSKFRPTSLISNELLAFSELVNREER